MWHPKMCPKASIQLIFPYGLLTETVLGDANPGLITFSKILIRPFLEINSQLHNIHL